MIGPLLLAIVALAGPAAAEIYRWTDDAGQNHYADGLDAVPERYRARATPVGLRNSPASATTAVTESAVRPGPSGGTIVRFAPGERILVDARVNGGHSVRLLLDTGADKTLIAPRALVASGVSLARQGIRGSIVGVTGKADVQGVKIDSLEVGEARVGPLFVVSYDMNQPRYDGLLGRDFLEHFDVAIDSSRGVVTITPKR
jgi:Aspartyl protease/Domain of unknown function (DUF4124)